MDFFITLFDQASGLQLAIVGALVLLVWFLPAILALFFNPKHLKYIILACIPAGISFIAWSGVVVWAVTGKVFDKYSNKVTTEKTEVQQ